MRNKGQNFIVKFLGIFLVFAITSCGGMGQNLTNDSLTVEDAGSESSGTMAPTTQSLGGTDAGTPPITIIISRSITGTLGENEIQPDSIVFKDVFGNETAISVEPQAGAVFTAALELPDNVQIFETIFLKDNVEIAMVSNDNGQLALPSNYFLVSPSDLSEINLGTVSLLAGTARSAEPVAKHNDLDRDGQSDYDDSESCVPALVAIANDTYDELMDQICEIKAISPHPPEVGEFVPVLNSTVDVGAAVSAF